MIKPAPLKPFPFRALSPCHAVEMQLDYLLQVVEAARRYGFNAIQICGATHDDIGNLDGLTEFARFGKANDIRDMSKVAEQRDILRQVCRAAHEHDMEVYYWHHELWYPTRLAEVYPDWFVPAPQNQFTRDLRGDGRLVPRIEPDAPFWAFMDAKFDEAFEQCPELDGTIMTIQEAQVPIYCLFEDFEQQVASLVDLYKRLEAAHKRVGKKWIIRTFAWRELEYRIVTEALERWRPSVPVESKGVPMDWSLYYIYDPLLGRFDWAKNHVELAPSCEFHGCTSHPVGHPWFYTENLRYAAERGHTGTALRIDRAGVSMLGGPDEGVLACIGAWLNDPEGTDVGEVYVQWLQERYRVDRDTAFKLLWEVLDKCWDATLHTYHHDKIYIGDAFGLKYERSLYLAERDCCVEHDDPEPLAEKDQAVEVADAAAGALAKLRSALTQQDADDLTRRVRLLQLASRAYRAMVAMLVARRRQMYKPSEASRQAVERAIDDLEAAGANVSKEFADRESVPGRSWQGHWRLGPLVREFAQAARTELPKLPTRAIVQTLGPDELGANATHRNRPCFQPGAEGVELALKGQPGAKHVLVLFAGTEMCVRRPLELRSGAWSHRFDIGQYAWFLSHDRFRRYEVALPDDCADKSGNCRVKLIVPESEHAPYLRCIRLEVETHA